MLSENRPYYPICRPIQFSSYNVRELAGSIVPYLVSFSSSSKSSASNSLPRSTPTPQSLIADLSSFMATARSACALRISSPFLSITAQFYVSTFLRVEIVKFIYDGLFSPSAVRHDPKGIQNRSEVIKKNEFSDKMLSENHPYYPISRQIQSSNLYRSYIEISRVFL